MPQVFGKQAKPWEMTKEGSSKVLIFACRGHTDFFFRVAQKVFCGDIVCYSDWPSDIGARRYKNLMREFYKNYAGFKFSKQLSEADTKQIIYRCRVLRTLPYEQASQMVHSMYLTVDNLIAKYKPDYFFSRAVDNYIIDIFCRVCDKHNVRSILLIAGSIPNTILVTRYGEYNFIRNPSEHEVERALAGLMDDSAHITFGRKSEPYSFTKHLRAFCRFWAKNFVFRAWTFFSRDPLNFRFLSSFKYAEEGHQRTLNNFHFPQFDSNWEDTLAMSKLPILYIPLNYIPECTTDYWLHDINMIRNHETFVLELTAALSKHFTLLIKEHWSMLGRRKSTFYDALKQISNVILVPPETNNRRVLQKVDKVLLGVGTTGIEAALRGKGVVTLGLPYYYVKGYFMSVRSINQLSSLPDTIKNLVPHPLTAADQKKIVRRILETSIPGSLLPNSSLTSTENLELVSSGIQKYLNQL